MALIPYRRNRGDLATLHKDMDDLFGDFFGGWPSLIHQHKIWPAIDVAENENDIQVKAELPGCKANDIDISVHKNTMSISGEKKQSEEKKEGGYYYAERSYGSFRREITLPTDVDISNIDAACKDGVLTVTLPKLEKAKTVKVKIKGE